MLLAYLVKHYYDWRMNTNLDQIILGLLEARRGDWQAVSKASGISYSWLSKFANGHIENPGYSTLKKLFDALQTPQAPAIPEQAATENIAVGGI